MFAQRSAGFVAYAAADHLMGAATSAPAPAYDGCDNRVALAAAPKRILRSMGHLHLHFVEDITHLETDSFKDSPLSAFRRAPLRQSDKLTKSRPRCGAWRGPLQSRPYSSVGGLASLEGELQNRGIRERRPITAAPTADRAARRRTDGLGEIPVAVGSGIGSERRRKHLAMLICALGLCAPGRRGAAAQNDRQGGKREFSGH